MDFFIYVIESPSSEDVFVDRHEGSLIYHAAKLNGIECIIRNAFSPELFEHALKTDLPHLMKENRACPPIIHISAHGNKNGIHLTNEEIISWPHLCELLIPINKLLNGGLFLCMSSCKGFAALRMSFSSIKTQLPFSGVIGNTGEPLWNETGIAYATFYNLLKKGEPFDTIVEAMKKASGNPNFLIAASETSECDFFKLFGFSHSDPQID